MAPARSARTRPSGWFSSTLCMCMSRLCCVKPPAGRPRRGGLGLSDVRIRVSGQRPCVELGFVEHLVLIVTATARGPRALQARRPRRRRAILRDRGPVGISGRSWRKGSDPVERLSEILEVVRAHGRCGIVLHPLPQGAIPDRGFATLARPRFGAGGRGRGRRRRRRQVHSPPLGRGTLVASHSERARWPSPHPEPHCARTLREAPFFGATFCREWSLRSSS